MQIYALALALIFLTAPAAAQVNKCEGPNGPVYQQAPCAGEGEAIGGISITPGISPEQQREIERQQAERRKEASDKRQQKIDDSYREIRRIQKENYDPEKCDQARADLFMLVNRGEPEYSTTLFTAREYVKLYCRP